VLVVRHEQVAGIPEEDPVGVKRLVVLEHLQDILVEPGLQPLGPGVPGQLAEEVLVARGLPVIGVLVIEPRAA